MTSVILILTPKLGNLYFKTLKLFHAFQIVLLNFFHPFVAPPLLFLQSQNQPVIAKKSMDDSLAPLIN